MVQALADDGHRVTLVAFAARGEALVDLGPLRAACAEVELVPTPLALNGGGRDALKRVRALASPLPFGAWKFRSPELRGALERQLARHDFDVLLCDGAEPATVLFQGGMDWQPNRDAVEFFAAEILPWLRRRVPSARFRVAGRSPAESFRRRFAGIDGLEFTGTVADMRDEIAKATVCVVPLRIGSGTRLKILEAGAMAKPMVSTGLGAEGLELVDGEEIVLADEPRAFADAVAALLHDAAGRDELGRGARLRVEKQYSLSVFKTALRDAVTGSLR